MPCRDTGAADGGLVGDRRLAAILRRSGLAERADGGRLRWTDDAPAEIRRLFLFDDADAAGGVAAKDAPGATALPAFANLGPFQPGEAVIRISGLPLEGADAGALRVSLFLSIDGGPARALTDCYEDGAGPATVYRPRPVSPDTLDARVAPPLEGLDVEPGSADLLACLHVDGVFEPAGAMSVRWQVRRADRSAAVRVETPPDRFVRIAMKMPSGAETAEFDLTPLNADGADLPWDDDLVPVERRSRMTGSRFRVPVVGGLAEIWLAPRPRRCGLRIVPVTEGNGSAPVLEAVEPLGPEWPAALLRRPFGEAGYRREAILQIGMEPAEARTGRLGAPEGPRAMFIGSRFVADLMAEGQASADGVETADSVTVELCAEYVEPDWRFCWMPGSPSNIRLKTVLERARELGVPTTLLLGGDPVIDRHAETLAPLFDRVLAPEWAAAQAGSASVELLEQSHQCHRFVADRCLVDGIEEVRATFGQSLLAVGLRSLAEEGAFAALAADGSASPAIWFADDHVRYRYQKFAEPPLRTAMTGVIGCLDTFQLLDLARVFAGVLLPLDGTFDRGRLLRLTRILQRSGTPVAWVSAAGDADADGVPVLRPEREEVAAFLGRILQEGAPARARPDTWPRVLAASVSRHPELLPRLVGFAESQSAPVAAHVIVMNMDEADVAPCLPANLPGHVRVLCAGADKNVGYCLRMALAAADHDIWVKPDDDDYFGPDFVADAVHALLSTGAEFAGCLPRYFRFDDDPTVHERLRFRGRENMLLSGGQLARFPLPGATLCGTRRGEDMAFYDPLWRGAADAEFVREIGRTGARVAVFDSENFVLGRRRDDRQHTWRVSLEELSAGGLAVKNFDWMT